MTDQPQDPTPPSEEPPTAAPGPPPQHPASGPPPQAPAYGAPPPAPAYGAPPPAPAYGAPPPVPAHGGPQPQQPPYPPPAANPYGGYSQAPVYAGGRPTHPGSIGYVELYFGQVATFGQRALALIIDTLLALIGFIPAVIGFFVLIAAAPTRVVDEFGSTVLEDGDATMAAVGGILIGLGVLISLGITLWNRVFRMGRTGQSVGKSAMSLKLIDDKNGRPIGAGMCFVREIVAGLANQIFYLSWLWMLWDTDKQTLADKAVHSTVVVLQK